MRDGVTASQVYLPPFSQYLTVFEYLCNHFPHISESEWYSRFQQGLVLNTSGEKIQLQTPFTALANRHIYYYRFLENEVIVPFSHQILFENDEFLVIDKPHFLTISPTGQYVKQTLLTRLKQQTQNPNLTPIHRLDRETAGLVLFSKNTKTRGQYQELFAQKNIYKVYHAIAPYHQGLSFPQNVQCRLEKGTPFYTMQVVEGQANSFTQIDVLEIDSHKKYAKYRLLPQTGKQHQLRVHLNLLGIPILNDAFYPTVQHKNNDDFSQPLQLLAKELSFIDPISKETWHFISPQELLL